MLYRLPNTTIRPRLESHLSSESTQVREGTSDVAAGSDESRNSVSPKPERSGIDHILESLMDSGSQAYSTRGRSTSTSSSNRANHPYNQIEDEDEDAANGATQSLPVTRSVSYNRQIPSLLPGSGNRARTQSSSDVATQTGEPIIAHDGGSDFVDLAAV